MYKVIESFTDLQDGNFLYKVGDEFPRKGMEVTEGRLTELATSANRRGIPLIQMVEEPKEEPTEVKKPKRAKKKEN